MYSVYGNYDRGRVYTCTISCKFHNPLNRCPFARARPYKSCSENFSFFFSASLVIDPTDKVYTYRTKWPSKGLPELYIMTPKIGVLVIQHDHCFFNVFFSIQARIRKCKFTKMHHKNYKFDDPRSRGSYDRTWSY